MSDIPNRPPLWREMFDAYDTAPAAPPEADNDWTHRHGYAAEIRAVRDWLVPEETEPQAHLVDGECNPLWDHWRARQRLRDKLTAEADRAERGDD